MTTLPKEISDDLKGKADWMAAYVHGLSNHLSREELNSYRNTYAKFIELTTPYATQLHTLQQENELKYQIAINSNKLKDSRIEELATENADVKRRLAECEALLFPLLEYGQSEEARFPLGISVTTGILARAKGYERLRKALRSLVLSVTAHPDYTGEDNEEWTDLIDTANAALIAQPEADKTTH